MDDMPPRRGIFSALRQVIFWPTAQTVQNLPMPSPSGVSPRQISSGGTSQSGAHALNSAQCQVKSHGKTMETHTSWGFKASHVCHDVSYSNHALALTILAGDPLRFLGSGYPPRQMLTARKGGDCVPVCPICNKSPLRLREANNECPEINNHGKTASAI